MPIIHADYWNFLTKDQIADALGPPMLAFEPIAETPAGCQIYQGVIVKKRTLKFTCTSEELENFMAPEKKADSE